MLKINLMVFLAMGMLFITACKESDKKMSEEDTSMETSEDSDFKISLAQWSLHQSFFGERPNWQEFGRLLQEAPDSLLNGDIDPANFPSIAAGYGINTIELVNTFYFNKAKNTEYWDAFLQQCKDNNVNVGLIMCDALGNIGDADEVARMKAVENHYQWVDAAKYLGAHSIRVNAAGQGTAEEVAANAVKGLSKLGEYGKEKGINIIVENHGGYSSDGNWLSGVMKEVGMDNVGTLPDFGNFCIERTADGCANEFDRYKGTELLMPYAKGVSAKTHDFDENGNETHTDYLKMMKIVKDSGFKGYVGIEYEGSELSEDEGIKATKALLEKVFSEL